MSSGAVSIVDTPRVPHDNKQIRGQHRTCNIDSATPSDIKKWKRIFLGVGVTEIVLGIVSIIFGVAAIMLGYFVKLIEMDTVPDSRYNLSFSSQGIWCGMFLIASGLLSVVTHNDMSIHNLKVNKIIGTIGCCISLVLIVLSAIAAAMIPSFSILVGLHSAIACSGFCCLVTCIMQSIYSSIAISDIGKSAQKVQYVTTS